MKTAIYIEDGVVQLVLTPESEFEKNAIASFQDKPTTTKIYAGSFYDCLGGCVRQKEHYPTLHGIGDRGDDKSLILRIDASGKTSSTTPCSGCKFLADRRCLAEQQYTDFSCRKEA